MKQTRLYLSILFLLSLVAACNKDEEETENRTKLLTVTGNHWQWFRKSNHETRICL